MCTVSVKIDETVLRDVLPELDSPTAIRRWAQLLIDQHIESLTQEYAHQHAVDDEAVDMRFSRDMAFDDPYNGLEPDDLRSVFVADDDEVIDLETARAMLHQTIREEYARP